MTHNRCLRKQMAQQMFLTLTIETDVFYPHNRNRWQTGWRHAWPILLFAVVVPFYALLRQRAAAGLPTFTYTLSNLFGEDDHRYYGRDRENNQGRRKASERCALRR